jgi:hypothetical protein
MADTTTATDVRVGGAAQPGPLVAGANSAVRPMSMSMPVVDRVASGVGTPVTLIRLIIGKYFICPSHLLIWQDLLMLATAAP